MTTDLDLPLIEESLFATYYGYNITIETDGLVYLDRCCDPIGFLEKLNDGIWESWKFNSYFSDMSCEAASPILAVQGLILSIDPKPHTTRFVRKGDTMQPKTPLVHSGSVHSTLVTLLHSIRTGDYSLKHIVLSEWKFDDELLAYARSLLCDQTVEKLRVHIEEYRQECADLAPADLIILT